jgi:pimeloyl-ACP methyl ester carboxylesterase
MTVFKGLLAASLLAAGTLLPAPASAQPTIPPIPGCTVPGDTLPSGAYALICVPPANLWNGQLIVFAHGYVPPLTRDPVFANLQLPDGTLIPQVAMGLGFAFATTTYRQNGLAILEGVDDIRELVGAFPSPVPTHVVGVSEGGLVATLLAERWPELFRSAVAACAPIGSFRAQIDSIGDFRVLFDYFFPEVKLGSPITIDPAVIAAWPLLATQTIPNALAANPAAALELMKVSRAAYDPADPSTIAKTTVNMLTYNVLGANDAAAKLGGNPFGNRLRWYFGSSNDLKLNLSVKRVSADPVARAALEKYETNGNLSIPLVTLHTTRDEVIPFWHELLYLPKVDLADRGRFLPIPVARYGHCNFTVNEVVAALALAVRQP